MLLLPQIKPLWSTRIQKFISFRFFFLQKKAKDVGPPLPSRSTDGGLRSRKRIRPHPPSLGRAGPTALWIHKVLALTSSNSVFDRHGVCIVAQCRHPHILPPKAPQPCNGLCLLQLYGVMIQKEGRGREFVTIVGAFGSFGPPLAFGPRCVAGLLLHLPRHFVCLENKFEFPTPPLPRGFPSDFLVQVDQS